ncbi:MAG: TlpA family protein disulfide reductase [Thermoflexibacteraceae bacterium]
MKKTAFLFSFLTFIVFITKAQTMETGLYHATLQLEKTTLPFLLDLQKENNQYIGYFVNGEERLKTDLIQQQGDSLKIPFQLFDCELIVAQKTGQGFWVRYGLGTPYQLPLQIRKLPTATAYRFAEKPNPKADFSGKWEVDFLDANGKSNEKAVGIFQQDATGKATGTFLTTTGDYRFLAGEVLDNQLLLSCFDGSHAWVFKATQQADGGIKGEFFAGKTGYQQWQAQRNATFELPSAESLTFLKEGYDKLSFQFVNTKGEKVSLDDARYKNKVVVVQLLGSLCPNSMYQKPFHSPIYDKYRQKVLEVIVLAYERSPIFEEAKVRVEKMIQRFGIQYEVLVAGTNDKAKAAATLPALNKVLAFPTTIFIDKKGKVRKIHTGFSGAGTGKYYTEFVENFEVFIDKLLKE